MNGVYRLLASAVAAALFSCLASTALAAGEVRVLHTFSGGANDGYMSFCGVYASGTTLYGAAYTGGAYSMGVVYRLETDGSGFRVLHSFAGGADGDHPVAAPILVDGVLYGASSDWAGNASVFYRVNPDGSGYTALTSRPYGYGPDESLSWHNGMLYGVAPGGGYGAGSLFQLNPDGSGFEESLKFGFSYSIEPHGPLLQIGDAFYGISDQGGSKYNGALFKVNPDGTGYEEIHAFAKNGSHAANSLINVGDELFGVLSSGGTGQGEVFKINMDGSDYVQLHVFPTSGDGRSPREGLVQVGDMLYGTTSWGGANSCGTIFRIGTDGTGYSTVFDFDYTLGYPRSGLVLCGDALYGVSDGQNGTIFAFPVPEPSTLLLVVLGAAFLKKPRKSPAPGRAARRLEGDT